MKKGLSKTLLMTAFLYSVAVHAACSPAPGGSWTQTCREASNSCGDGHTLLASCKNTNGNNQNSSLDLNTCYDSGVVNCNGTLTCVRCTR
jgi:hypothetical protein